MEEYLVIWLKVKITRRLMDEHRVVTLDDSGQSVKQKSSLTNTEL